MFKENSALMALKQNLELKKEKTTGVVKFTRQSFGFLELEDRSIFIPPPLMKELLPEDLVEVTVDKEDDRETVASIVKVISSAGMSMTGKVVTKEWKGKTSHKFISNNPGFASMIPFDGPVDGLEDNDWVSVALTGHPSKERLFKVNHLSTIGNEGNRRLPWDYIRTQFDINKEITSLSIDNKLADISMYEDRTTVPYVTIDSESTRDMDDAIHGHEDKENWYLSVAIADPSDVIHHSEEQRKIVTSRGFTFYLPADVVHMIPKELSENVFSLGKDKVRATVCIDIAINKETGNIESYEFCLAKIKSHDKLSYNYVTDILEQGIELNESYYESLIILEALTSKLRSQREISEAVFNERSDYSLVINDYCPVGIKVSSSNLANRIVEESMIISNKLFAKFADENNLNVLFNTNEGFKSDSREDILSILEDADIDLINDDLFSTENVVNIQQRINTFLSKGTKSEKVKFENILNRLRRCFSRSIITTEALPHKIMGLALYATWTSPLRKSCDMINHIALKRFLIGQKQAKISEHEIESINERLLVSRQSERFLSKILYAKLFSLKPELMKRAKVVGVKKQMALLEIDGCEQYCTLQYRNVRTGAKVFADMDDLSVKSKGKTLFALGDSINIGYHSSNMIHQDIEATYNA